MNPCGTRAAYVRHLRHGEVACEQCKAANAEYRRRYGSDYRRGYVAALDAAREAVAALRIDYPSGVTAAIAAIDALREEWK